MSQPILDVNPSLYDSTALAPSIMLPWASGSQRAEVSSHCGKWTQRWSNFALWVVPKRLKLDPQRPGLQLRVMLSMFQILHHLDIHFSKIKCGLNLGTQRGTSLGQYTAIYKAGRVCHFLPMFQTYLLDGGDVGWV